MRKRICVIMGEADCEYAREIVPEICKAAWSYDYDVVMFSNYGAYDKSLMLYTDGEKTVIRIPDFQSFEGIIVEESIFNLEGMERETYERLSEYAQGVPIVYLKSEYGGVYSVLDNDRLAIRTLTEHFIETHHFTRICHFAGRVELDDAHERERGYRDAMADAKIPVTDNMVFWGDYWFGKAAEALDHFLAGGDVYPEAIVCANDFCAAAMTEELIRRGKRVPEDVCVSGYDGMDDSRMLDVPLTTARMKKEEMARMAVETIRKVRHGEPVPRIQRTRERPEILFRDSCGCGTYDRIEGMYRKFRYQEYHSYGLDMAAALDSGYHIAFQQEEIFTLADNYFRYNRAEVGYICLCEDAFSAKNRDVDKISDYTDRMVLKRIFYFDQSRNYDSPETVFDRTDILPAEFFDTEKPGLYFVYSIHSLNHCYGYMVLTYGEGNWVNKYTQIFVSSMGNAIDDYNVRSEYMDMDEIRRLYLIDELTELYNRRGYEQNRQTMIDRAKRRKMELILVNIDMDGLKYINDHFGHPEGDYGIRAVADAIFACIDPDVEVASRIGGDEFAAILLENERGTREADFAEAFDRALRECNERAGKPYEIHASCGMCKVENLSGDIQRYVNRADEIMYTNKRKYKQMHPLMVR
ncbi:MAG: GGDEF domain-containing protein [Lachnospiraceae bacterium]|nr:GGDEF domain-containing protein [Lachnospiraceae bacterium]